MDKNQPDNLLPPEEYLEIADKVRTGEYFREGRAMYDIMVHDQMSARYLYIMLTSVALMIFLVAFFGLRALYPLQSEVPFVVSSNNLVDEIPRIKSLLEHKGEEPGAALLRFYVRNYVTSYEEYDINTFDRNINGIRSQSSPQVFADFERLITPTNPDSPLTLYQRHSTRKINIISSSTPSDGDTTAEVVFEAIVTSKTDVKKSRWQADIAFNYSGLALDEETGKVKPVTFTVTSYRTKRLQDIR